MRPLILLCVVTGAGLVYLMSQASSNTTLFTQNYPALLGLGGLLSLGLMLLIGYQLLVLRRKLRDDRGAAAAFDLNAAFGVKAQLEAPKPRGRAIGRYETLRVDDRHVLLTRCRG